MTRVIRAAIMAGLSLWSVQVLAAAANDGLPAAGSTIALVPTSTGYEASIDISADENYSDLKLTSTDPDLRPKLETDVLKTQAKVPVVKRAIVRITTGRLQTGPHHVTLIALRQATDPPLERDIWLNVPAVTLDPPPSLIIVKVCYGLLFENRCRGLGESILANRPQLWEMSQHAWLTQITLIQKGDTDAGGEPAGTIVAKEPLEDSPPEVSRSLEFGKNYTLEGSFPLGTAKGKLAIEANQLATPVFMDFEIRSRITRALLLLALILGLVLGYATRHFLKGRMDLNQERQKAFALLELIENTAVQIKDPQFLKDIANSRSKAKQAIAAKTPDEVKQLTADAQKAYLDAQEAFRVRRTETDQLFADALTVLRARWRVPGSLATEVSKVRSAVEEVQARRSTNDLQQEQSALEKILRYVNDVADKVVSNCAKAQGELDTLIGLLIPLFDPVGASGLHSMQKPGATPSQTPTTASIKVRIDSLRTALEYVHTVCAYIDDAIATVRTLLANQVIAWESQLKSASLPDRAQWTGWVERARELLRELEAIPRDYQEFVTRLGAMSKELLAALREAILAQVGAQDRPAIESKLNAGSYGDAIATIARLAAPKVSRGLEGLDAYISSATEPPVFALAAAPSARLGSTLPALAYTTAAASHDDVSTVAFLAAASRRSLEVTGWLLTLIYGAIIVAGGYFLFADKWVGTQLDFATVFFWAFATDVGVDAATTVMRGLKK